MPEEATDPSILLVDQDHDFLEWATRHLAAKRLGILRCDQADKALKVVSKTRIDVVVADLQLQPFDGLDLLSKIREVSPATIFILTTGFPSTGQVIEATQKGAHDVLRKEALPFELRPVVENALQVAEDRRNAGKAEEIQPQGPEGRIKIIGVSRSLQQVFKVVGRVARSDAPVLVSGESGTGKELVALAIHEYSPRRQREFLAINCGAIPENLLESELFGHEKGAFTGAIARRPGRFEQADGGTLFLDEIGEMPLSVQVKLLRVLQDGTFSRVGSNETLTADARIVAATNRNLAEEVSKGNFREDLYYRLNVVEIRLPPLRERPEDIPLLAEFFLRRITRKNGMARIRLSTEAIAILRQHHWPGNVRELENTISRACALASSNVLLPADIHLTTAPGRPEAEIREMLDALLDALPPEGGRAWLRARIGGRLLERHDGDIKGAASALGITATEFKKWL